MGKPRGLLKKIRDTKGTFHAKMGTVKDRNGMDLTEAEDIKKRWQEYTEKLYKKDLYDPDNHNGVITHLEPDIMECEVKWALGNITMNKASGGDGTPVELFQILKDDAVKVLNSVCQQIWKTQRCPQDQCPQDQVSFQSPKKGNAKDCSNYCTIALMSHASKVMLRILQTRLQQYVHQLLLDIQVGFRKGRGTRGQIANIRWIIKKARKLQKNIYFCLINYAKTFDCVDHNKLWKIQKEMAVPDNLTCLLRNLYAGQEATVRTRHGTTDWLQTGKRVCQGCILPPSLFNLYAEFSSVQSLIRVQLFVTPWTAAYHASLPITNSWSLLRLMSIKMVMPSNHLILVPFSSWMKHKLELRLLGEKSIINLRYADDTTLMAESEEKLKSPLMDVKEESEKLA